MASRDFIIVRLGDVNDPAAPLEFFPPKGSDELHDALRSAYPHLPNLQSRMREAVIEFYLEEKSVEESLPSQFTPDMMESSFISSPVSSFGTSAPTTIYTPPSTEDAPSSTAQTPATAPSQQDLMTVWTLPTSAQAKIHRRRNMTTDEKVKYKAKRLTGACEDCRRRRRKCEHDRSKAVQNVSPFSASKTSHRQSASSTRPIARRALSAKVESAAALSSNTVPSSLLYGDALLPNANAFDTPALLSMEMSAIDPSLLPLESQYNADYFDVPFDLSNDFELSPFLATQWDVHAPLSPNFDTMQVIPGFHSPLVRPVSRQRDFVQRSSLEQSADMAPPGPEHVLGSLVRERKMLDIGNYNTLDPKTGGERSNHNYVELGLGSQFLGAAKLRVPPDQFHVGVDTDASRVIGNVGSNLPAAPGGSTQTEVLKKSCPVRMLSNSLDTSSDAWDHSRHLSRMPASAVSDLMDLNESASFQRKANVKRHVNNVHDPAMVQQDIHLQSTTGINIVDARPDALHQLSRAYSPRLSNDEASQSNLRPHLPTRENVTVGDISPKDLPLRAVTESLLSSTQNTKTKVATSKATALALATIPALFCALCFVVVACTNVDLPMQVATLVGIAFAMSSLVVPIFACNATGTPLFGKVGRWEFGRNLASSIERGQGVRALIGRLACRYGGCIL